MGTILLDRYAYYKNVICSPHILIYYSTDCDNVIFVFLNVVVHQKRLFSILDTCIASCLCATIGRGSEGGIFTFRLWKQCASLFVATWLLAWSEKQYVIKIKMSGMGSNLAQPVFMFSFYKHFIRNKY